MSEASAYEFYKVYIDKDTHEHENETKEKCADFVMQSIRNQLYMLRIWADALDRLPPYKQEGLIKCCSAIPAFHMFSPNFKQLVESWSNNFAHNLTNIAVLYSSILFLKGNNLLDELNVSHGNNVTSEVGIVSICCVCQQLLSSPPSSELIRCPRCSNVNYIIPNSATTQSASILPPSTRAVFSKNTATSNGLPALAYGEKKKKKKKKSMQPMMGFINVALPTSGTSPPPPTINSIGIPPPPFMYNTLSGPVPLMVNFPPPFVPKQLKEPLVTKAEISLHNEE